MISRRKWCVKSDCLCCKELGAQNRLPNTPATISVMVVAYLRKIAYPVVYISQYDVLRTSLVGVVQKAAAKLGRPPSSSATG